MWPSGKACAFDAHTRRFESYHPCHIFYFERGITVYENPFMNSHSVFVKDSEAVYFNDGTEKENIKKTEEYLKEIKAAHPQARIYGSLKFGDFRYRVSY